ncbi:MAG: DUF502 domain-containing protein [Halobacteriaceae archaeon]
MTRFDIKPSPDTPASPCPYFFHGIVRIHPIVMAGTSIPDDRDDLYAVVREALLTGLAVIVPLLITVYVLTAAVGIITDILSPVVDLLRGTGIAPASGRIIVQALAVFLLTVIVVLVGVTTRFQGGQRALRYFDLVVERLPGIGTVYKSFRRMSDVMLESDSENFEGVKLVEFPVEGAYTLGFKTTETPDRIKSAASDQTLQTLFLPLAPNPVTTRGLLAPNSNS